MKTKSDWEKVCDEEAARIRRRRALLRKRDKCTCRIPENTVGLALSGGGIRSATFSLGLMRSLSEQRLIHCIDYLSTVSGGGYAGAIFCSLFVPNKTRGPAPLPTREAGEPDPDGDLSAAQGEESDSEIQEGARCDVLGQPSGSNAIARLRQGGHYLAPNGSSDALFAGVIAVRNWFAVAIATGLALLAVFFFVNFLVAALDLVISRIPDPGFGIKAREPYYRVWYCILAILAFWPVCCAWAYWFTRCGVVPLSRVARLFSMQTVVAFLIFVLAYYWPATQTEGWHPTLRYSIMALTVLSFLAYVLAELVSFRRERHARARTAKDRVEAFAEEDRVRNRLSRWLLRGTVTFIVAGIFAALYWATGRQIFKVDEAMRNMGPYFLLVSALTAAILILLTRAAFTRRGEEFHAVGLRGVFSRSIRQRAALVVGMVLLAAFLLFWATMADGASRWIMMHPKAAWENLGFVIPGLEAAATTWILDPLDILPQSRESTMLILLLLALKVGLVAYLMGNIDSLLNRSSFSTFYSGRLRAAYLGATNERRQRLNGHQALDADPAHGIVVPLDRDDPNDEITLSAYYSKSVVAPIHLINVTINETTSLSSRVIQRDRKGKSMTVSPSGYLYPPRSPAEPLAMLRRREAEDLPLSAWMAISGAAFTTGAGHHTSLGTAMLATLSNVRLGYWWNSRNGSKRWRLRGPRRLVQAYLLRELRASYEGTGSCRWYLSDGGHYENTGVYELIRRRIPFIIASDNGADPHYEFSDLVNLMRKARIDFGTEIEFLDNSDLDAVLGDTPLREVFGSLDEIRTTGKEATRAVADPEAEEAKAGPYATLARIHYPKLADREASTGTLLLIKPRITGRELPDLIQYRHMNAAFPQQPTTNQFFDEAQWESYYRLGQLIGDTIFKKDRFQAEPGKRPWLPWELEPLPARAAVKRQIHSSKPKIRLPDYRIEWRRPSPAASAWTNGGSPKG